MINDLLRYDQKFFFSTWVPLSNIQVKLISNEWLKLMVSSTLIKPGFKDIELKFLLKIFTVAKSFLDWYSSLDAHAEYGNCVLMFKINKMLYMYSRQL